MKVFKKIILSLKSIEIINSPLKYLAEQAVQEQIAEMQATWQDPTAAWEDHNSEAWEEPQTINTTSVQIENVNNVSDSTLAQTDAAGVIKCIAFYPYTVNQLDKLLLKMK